MEKFALIEMNFEFGFLNTYHGCGLCTIRERQTCRKLYFRSRVAMRFLRTDKIGIRLDRLYVEAGPRRLRMFSMRSGRDYG